MPNISITIPNLANIKAAYSKAPALMTKELNTAIKKVLLNIQGQSMRNTPVLTGRLKGSTYTKFQALKGEVGTNTVYDRFVHEGTRFMRARPYLRKAVDSKQKDTDRYFLEAVENVLTDIGDKT
jgi:HK97 gp10 family phage protein